MNTVRSGSSTSVSKLYDNSDITNRRPSSIIVVPFIASSPSSSFVATAITCYSSTFTFTSSRLHQTTRNQSVRFNFVLSHFYWPADIYTCFQLQYSSCFVPCRYQMFATTLSALYGKLLVVMGIAFPMSEVISTFIPPSFYEVVFFT